MTGVGRTPFHRFPVAPAVTTASLRANVRFSWKSFARVVEMDRGQLNRFRREGGFTPLVADRVAVGLGMHPAEIWADWFDVALAEMEQEQT